MQFRWEERIWICGRVRWLETRVDRQKERSRTMSPVNVTILAPDALLRTLVTLRVEGLEIRDQEEEALSLSARRMTVIRSQLAPSSHTAADCAN